MRVIKKDRFQKMPSAVFIDIDDTLYSYETAHIKAIVAVKNLVANKFEIAGKNFEEVFAAARADVKQCLEGAPSGRNRLLYFQKMFELIGVGSSPLDALNCEQTYWNTLMSESSLFPGVEEFLDELRLNGVPIIAVSNLTSQVQFRKLVYFELHEAFNFIVTSEQVGCEKPNPKIFEFALSRANCVGEDIWMVGDDLVCDIEGAKSAINATTLLKRGVMNQKISNYQAVDAHFSNFDKLTALLRRISDGKI
jgi:HAD superfamily hydrolase (TIGR01549 family)